MASKSQVGDSCSVLIGGGTGRMGLAIAKVIEERAKAGGKLKVVGGLVAPNETVESHSKVPMASAYEDLPAGNIIIDFSSDEGTRKALQWALAHGLGLVVGTTSLSRETEAMVGEAAKQLPVMRASNMSVGVTVLHRLVKEAARLLGPGLELEIVETHHHLKKDAPSGTALSLLESVRSLGPEFNFVPSFGREGKEALRGAREVGIHAIRGGDIAGEHTLTFFLEGERLELTHRAGNREIFARGAVKAAEFIAQRLEAKEAGMYNMDDVLGGS